MQVFHNLVSPNSKAWKKPLLHPATQPKVFPALCDNGAGGSGLVLPRGGQDTDGLIVAGQTVDSRLDQDQAELGVLVLAVALEVLADSDGLNGIRQ